MEEKFHRVCDDLRKSILIRKKLVDKLRIYKSAHQKIKEETSRFTKEFEHWRTIQKQWEDIQIHVEKLEKERDELKKKQNSQLTFMQIWHHVDVLTDDECEQLHSKLTERLNYPKQHKSKSTRVKKSRRATTGPNFKTSHSHRPKEIRTKEIRPKDSPLPKRHSIPLNFDHSRSKGASRTSKAVLNNAPVAPRHPNSRMEATLDNMERFRSDTTQAEAAAPVSKLSPFTQEL